jgi:hypothetical protein
MQMTTRPWNPDVEVAVHDQELVVTLDHLPEIEKHRFGAQIDHGEMLVRTETLYGEEDHRLHLPLPDGLEISHLETALHDEAFELHMTVSTL